MTTSNANNGVQHSSVLTIAAGPSGIGKTTDLILTWPRALFFLFTRRGKTRTSVFRS